MRYGIPFRFPVGGGHGRTFLFPVALVMTLLVLLSGCGKKADPVLPTVFVPRPVSDLSVQRIAEGINLSWAMAAEARDVARFRILRSELEAGGAGCPGCPREYLLIDDLAPGDRQLIREGGGKYRYNDFTVRPGRLYTYRVMACYGRDSCSEARESAEIKFD